MEGERETERDRERQKETERVRIFQPSSIIQPFFPPTLPFQPPTPTFKNALKSRRSS